MPLGKRIIFSNNDDSYINLSSNS